MSTRLADRLALARQNHFVGRAEELTLFRAALTTDELPFHVLFIHGVGGVGKTSLLQAFARLCEAAQIPCVHLDARHIEPSPASFLTALGLDSHFPQAETPATPLSAPSPRRVLLIDTYEMLLPLDGWLRETFLPQLPDSTLVVLAGRQPPTPAWLTDPGWSSLLRVVALTNLKPLDSRALLTRRHAPAGQHAAIIQFTHGHPLALSLVADTLAQQPDLQFRPETMPDVVGALVQQLRADAPSPLHRAALGACALARVLTEPLLAAMLDIPDAHALFEWLRDLSFIEAGPLGLFPHDLAREALAADLRWRDPDGYIALKRRAGAYLLDRLRHVPRTEAQHFVFDFMFLHRDSPSVRPFFSWQMGGQVFADKFRPGDGPALIRLAAQVEGPASARVVAHWLKRQPHGVTIFRVGGGPGASSSSLAGCAVWLALHEASEADLEADPVALAAWRYVQQHAPLRPGEGVSYRRFSMVSPQARGDSLTQDLLIVDFEKRQFAMPQPGPCFIAVRNPDRWTPLLLYAGLSRIPELDFSEEGRELGIFGVDCRVLPPIARFTLLAERLASAAPEAEPPPLAAWPLATLSQAEFETATRAALRQFSQPGGLQGNPLLESRLVAARVAPSAVEAERAQALRAALTEAVETLQSSPRHVKWYRALYHSYVRPAPTQEQAAALLDVPFSTYRRHLQAGMARVTETLWQWESETGQK